MSNMFQNATENLKRYRTKNQRRRRSWSQRRPWHMLRRQCSQHPGGSASVYNIWKQKEL